MRTTLPLSKLLDLREAARDAMQDDFPTTRHEGAARFKALFTPEEERALMGDQAGTYRSVLTTIDRILGGEVR